MRLKFDLVISWSTWKTSTYCQQYGVQYKQCRQKDYAREFIRCSVPMNDGRSAVLTNDGSYCTISEIGMKNWYWQLTFPVIVVARSKNQHPKDSVWQPRSERAREKISHLFLSIDIEINLFLHLAYRSLSSQCEILPSDLRYILSANCPLNPLTIWRTVSRQCNPSFFRSPIILILLSSVLSWESAILLKRNHPEVRRLQPSTEQQTVMVATVNFRRSLRVIFFWVRICSIEKSESMKVVLYWGTPSDHSIRHRFDLSFVDANTTHGGTTEAYVSDRKPLGMIVSSCAVSSMKWFPNWVNSHFDRWCLWFWAFAFHTIRSLNCSWEPTNI